MRLKEGSKVFGGATERATKVRDKNSDGTAHEWINEWKYGYISIRLHDKRGGLDDVFIKRCNGLTRACDKCQNTTFCDWVVQS